MEKYDHGELFKMSEIIHKLDRWTLSWNLYWFSNIALYTFLTNTCNKSSSIEIWRFATCHTFFIWKDAYSAVWKTILHLGTRPLTNPSFHLPLQLYFPVELLLLGFKNYETTASFPAFKVKINKEKLPGNQRLWTQDISTNGFDVARHYRGL